MPDGADPQALVRLIGVTKRFGGVVAVHPLDLTIRRGDFLAILGPSGCGKTTLLNMIAGFLFPDGGTVEIECNDVSRVPPERRPTNMVFQGYGLFPHMTVEQNIAYGLKIAGTPRAELRARVSEAIQLVHLDGLEARNVAELSGGQQQRVALARALIMRPKVLLLDEPLAALDLQLRKVMQAELRRIHRSIGGTFVFVTHDQGEAMALASRIAVMQAGRIVQEGTPRQIYNAPRSRFVSTFIGEANILRGIRHAGRITLEVGPSFESAGPDETVVVVIRPEAVRIGPRADQAVERQELALAGSIQESVFIGTYTRYMVKAGQTELIVHTGSDKTSPMIEAGAEVVIRWSSADHVILPDR